MRGTEGVAWQLRSAPRLVAHFDLDKVTRLAACKELHNTLVINGRFLETFWETIGAAIREEMQ